jgi:hypothetical protein
MIYRPSGDHSQCEELGALHNVSVCDRARDEEVLLEFGDLLPRADLPDIDPTSQITETRTKQKSALRLVRQEVPVIGAKRVDRLASSIEYLDLGGHV